MNLLSIYQPARCLRSQDNHLLTKPPVYTSIGRRAFSYAAQQIWNATFKYPQLAVSQLL